MADPPKPSWWSTLPGLITALAALLTATGALIGALNQAGVFAPRAVPSAPAPKPAPSPVLPQAQPAPIGGAAITLVPRDVRRLADGGTEVRVVLRNTGPVPRLVEPARELQLVSGEGAGIAARRSVPAFETLPPEGMLSALVEFPPVANAVSLRLGDGVPVPLPR
jgi:hypothetical protein